MAFPMHALVDEVRERSRAAPGKAAPPREPKPPLVYWRPIAAAAIFTLSFMVTMVVASRRSEAAPARGTGSPPETSMTAAPLSMTEFAHEPVKLVAPVAEAPRAPEPAAALTPPAALVAPATAARVVMPAARTRLSAASAAPRTETPVVHIPADPLVLERMEDLVARRPLTGVEPAEPIEPVKLPGVHRATPTVGAEPAAPGCERYGTAIDFVRNPKE